MHGYEEWGEDLPLRLNGMFAFAIYDAQRRRLFLARDRFGEKPLYYTATPAFFGFASELAVAGPPSRKSTARSIAARCRSTSPTATFPRPPPCSQARVKLPAGHWLSCDLDTLSIRSSCYWQFAITPDPGLTDADEPRLVDELEHLLRQATKRRMISDVPLGVFLSGGIDSSTVLSSLATGGNAAAIKTFTIGFHEPSFDESAYARIVARAFRHQPQRGNPRHRRRAGISYQRSWAASTSRWAMPRFSPLICCAGSPGSP